MRPLDIVGALVVLVVGVGVGAACFPTCPDDGGVFEYEIAGGNYQETQASADPAETVSAVVSDDSVVVTVELGEQIRQRRWRRRQFAFEAAFKRYCLSYEVTTLLLFMIPCPRQVSPVVFLIKPLPSQRKQNTYKDKPKVLGKTGGK